MKNFLREHGVPVTTRGAPGVSAAMNRFATLVDIRLDVPRCELAAAEEARHGAAGTLLCAGGDPLGQGTNVST